MLRVSANSFESKTLQNRNGQWLVCVNKFIGKTECDKQLHSPNGRVNSELRSPDSLDTRLGELASANVQPCVKSLFDIDAFEFSFCSLIVSQNFIKNYCQSATF